MALYGTYRPTNFSDVVGQESIKTTLLHASAQKRISHASLFCGTRGTGKTTSARIVAKALNCQNLLPSGDPCLECDFCTAAEEGRMTDIIEIDAASNRGIDEIRDLREKVNFSPTFGKAKIYIIDEVHMLTKEAFNALLKTLEEPPSHAYFILATTEFHKVPETIRSRCQIFFFRKISLQNIVARLEFICTKEGISCSRKGVEIIAERSNGGMRDAISLLEQSASFGDITEENLRESLGIISEQIFEDFLDTLVSGDSKKALSFLDALQEEGRNLEEFGKDFLGVLRQKFHLFLHEKDARLSWILQIIDIFEEALQKTRVYDIPPLAFEIAIARGMLLQKEFQEQLRIHSSHSEKKIVTKMLEEKHHIDQKRQESLQEWASDIPDDYKNISEKESGTHVVAPPAKKQLPKKTSSSVYDDDDMFPSDQSTSSISSPPCEEESVLPQKINPQKEHKGFSGDLQKNIEKHWGDILTLLPKSLSANIDKYGKISSVQGNHIVFDISSDAIKKLLNTEKKKEQVTKILSEKFEKQITIEYITSGEDSSSSFSQEEEKTKEEDIEISDMEKMLRF